MDGTELDEIMNEALASEVIEQAVVETPTQAETQPRDETGKFAPKQQEEEPQVDPDNAAQSAVEGGERGKVPVAAVQAEREKARLAREEAETLRRELAEIRGQVSVLTQQRQQPATPVEKAKPKSFWENPDEFLSERLAPVQQTVQQQRFELSRMLAEEKYGAEAVKAADDALGAMIQANDPAVAALQAQIADSRHPYADLVAFHEKRKALADIGDDPTVYRTRLETELREKIMAELGVDPAAVATPAAPSTPTKPLTKLPQSLSRLPGAGNGAGAADMSDAGIFTDAMGGR
jgi:hypothetical protein